MSSFEIADCPVRLDIGETFLNVQSGRDDKAGANSVAPKQRVQKGLLTLTIRNKTGRRQTGRFSVRPQEPAKPEWFVFEGAPPTSAHEIEQDFQANGTETVRLNVIAPENASSGRYLFNVRVTTEDDPDNDFVVSPNVAFDVATWTQAPPPREKFPWWAIVIAIALVILVGGAATYMLFDPSDDSPVTGPGSPSGPISIQMSLDGVLLASGWRTQAQLQGMSHDDKHNAIAAALRSRTRVPRFRPFFWPQYTDSELIGQAAIYIFILNAGIRKAEDMKAMTRDDLRNTLIVENDNHLHIGIPKLQGYDDQTLVILGESWFNQR